MNTHVIKTSLIKAYYKLAFHLARPALYTRQPFVIYPYLFSPRQLQELASQLLDAKCEGSVVEVGCSQGWTTCFLNEAMREARVERPYICIDTFRGFLKEDIHFENEKRGKKESYEADFTLNDKKWFDTSMQRAGYKNVRSYQADAATFDYASLGPIAFCLLDLDLYRPMKRSLSSIYSCLSSGGTIVVDDCKDDYKWDGAFQAYSEFCQERGKERDVVFGKLGIIKK
jgi:SAM-dependent methyltransferase